MDKHTSVAGTLCADGGRADLAHLDAVPMADSASLHSYVRCFRRDLPFHGFVAAYAACALLLAAKLGVPHKFAPLIYVRPLAAMVPTAIWIVLIVLALRSLRAQHPLRDLRDRVLRAFDPHITAGLLLFASLSIFIGVFSSVKTMLTDVAPFFADTRLADLDRLLHLGHDPWTFTMLPPVMTNALELVYAGVWGIALTVSMLAVLLVPALRPVRWQFAWTFLITWPLLGNLFAGACLSAGPTYYEWVTGDERFSELTQYLEQHSIVQRHARQFLWSAYLQGEAIAGAGISAFPSMHVATSTLTALFAARLGRAWMWTGVAFLATIQFGSVHLGWHYAVDGYVSIVVTVLIWIGFGLRSRPAPEGGHLRNDAQSVDGGRPRDPKTQRNVSAAFDATTSDAA